MANALNAVGIVIGEVGTNTNWFTEVRAETHLTRMSARFGVLFAILIRNIEREVSNMYRPEGWENEYGSSITQKAYEAGADAMLEGLKKDCYAEIKGSEPWYMYGVDETEDSCKGWLVFIPDEEVSDE